MTDNCVHTAKKLLNILGVPYTNQYLADTILSHPDHPSLLSITDTLEKYRVENMPLKINAEQLAKVPVPCIVQLEADGFSILHKFSNDVVDYFDHKGKAVRTTAEDFTEKWTGICLLAEKGEGSIEPGYEKNAMAGKLSRTLLVVAGTLLIIWMALRVYGAEVAVAPLALSLALVYMFLKITGLAVGGLLLWFEVDRFSPTLQAFCSGGKKTDCGAVLNSKYATI
jgi:ABC-type bacteriocin/lantibiotic exporter with double-glycine peptidase domain